MAKVKILIPFAYQGLTDHQRELLKIPITAKRVSLLSVSPGAIILFVRHGLEFSDINSAC